MHLTRTIQEIIIPNKGMERTSELAYEWLLANDFNILRREPGYISTTKFVMDMQELCFELHFSTYDSGTLLHGEMYVVVNTPLTTNPKEYNIDGLRTRSLRKEADFLLEFITNVP